MLAPLVKVKAKMESQRGLTLIPIVVFMAIIGLLLLGYLDQARTQREMGMTRAGRKAGQELSCQKTRRALEQQIMSWVMNNPGKDVTLRNLQEDGIVLTGCPQGGQYSQSGGKIHCSVHSG